MKNLLFAFFLLSFAATKAGQSIKLDKNQDYYCYHEMLKDKWELLRLNETYKPSEWRLCEKKGGWKFVGINDNKTYCGTCNGDSACGGNCIL